MTSAWADSDSSVDAPDEIGAIAEEFLSLVRQGLSPQISDFCNRYPELATRISDLFPMLLIMEQCGEAANSGLSPTAVKTVSSPSPKSIGDFHIVREIGRGGMGIVYEAEQQSLGRRVALKVLPPSATISTSATERFRRESRSAARLHHSNIVPVFGVGEHEGLHYYVMQYIDGVGLDKVLVQLDRSQRPAVFKSLDPVNHDEGVLHEGPATLAADKLRPHAEGRAEEGRGSAKSSSDTSSGSGGNISSGSADRIYWRHVATIGYQLAGALHFAHTQGVLHRDVKPANVLLDREGIAWLTDFGLAQATEDTNLTRSGDIVGTLRYLAPERLRGECSPQSDVYGLGVTLFELIALSPAFPENDRAALIKQIVHQDPKRPRAINRSIPRDLETIVLKAIAKEPASRYRTAEELADDLSRYLRDLPIQARRAVMSEKLWRWCRRNPIVASLGAAVGLLTVSLLFGWAMFGLVQADRDSARRAELAAEQARASAASAETVALAQTQLTLSSALRKSDSVFRKSKSLEAIDRAISFSPPEHITQDLRNEAIASLALADLKPGKLYEYPEDDCAILNFSADLSRYATLHFRRQEIVVWDVKSLKTLFRNAVASIDILTLSRDGRFLAMSDELFSGEVNVWDVDRGIQILGPLKDSCFDFSGSDKIVVGNDQGSAIYFDLTDGKELRRHKIPCVPNILRISPDGNQIAISSKSDDRRMFIVDAHTGMVQGELMAEGTISDCDWHPDNRRIALACHEPANAEIWDSKACKQLSVLAGHAQNIQQVAFNELGDVCTTTSWDGTVRVWESGTGLPIAALTSSGMLHRGKSDVIALQNVKEGQREVKFDRSLGFKRLAAGNKQPRVNYVGGQAAIDGRLLATATYTGIQLWDLAGPSVIAELPGRQVDVLSIDLDLGELNWAEVGSGLFRSPIERGDTGWRLGPRSRWTEPDIDHAATTPDRRFWGLVKDGVVQILDSRGKTLSKFDAPGDDSLWLSPDGRFCATTQWHSLAVSLWDTSTGRVLKRYRLRQTGSAFTPDSKEWILINGSEYLFIDLQSFEVTRRIPRMDCAFAGPIAFSPCGKLAAMQIHWGMVDLVRTDTYQTVATLECPHPGHAGSMEFIGPHATLCVFYMLNGEFHIWELDEIRQRLHEMGLDWQDGQPNAAFVRPVRASSEEAVPKTITVVDQGRTAADLLIEGRKAIAAAEERFANEPKSTYATSLLAWNLVVCPVELRDAARAARLLEDLQLREKLDVTSRNTLATAYFRSERFHEAIKVYRENLSVQRDESLGFDLYPLAMCYWKVGERDRAHEILEWAERLYRVHPKNAQVDELRQFRDEALQLLRDTDVSSKTNP